MDPTSRCMYLSTQLPRTLWIGYAVNNEICNGIWKGRDIGALFSK